MSSIRKTPEHAAYGLLPTEAVAEAAADAAADDPAADEAVEEVAEAAEAAEEAAVSGLDPSGSASSSGSLRSPVKAAGEASSATRPGKDFQPPFDLRATVTLTTTVASCPERGKQLGGTAAELGPRCGS
jgi:hypothetical protein